MRKKNASIKTTADAETQTDLTLSDMDVILQNAETYKQNEYQKLNKTN